MTARALLRWAAGFALAILVAAAWTTPGEAHPGHSRTPAVSSGHAANGHAGIEREAAPKSEPGAARSQAIAAAERDCGGHQAGADEGKSCCSNSCHAVMSTDLALPAIVSTILAVGPSSAEPAAHTGPAIYIKRPPRPSAA